jgi:hypothetical protein
VGTPATTSGVFEQEESDGILKEKIKELEEKLKEKTKLVSFLYYQLKQAESKPRFSNEEGMKVIINAIKQKKHYGI